MKAEYNKWYKCQEGQMPEDFENIKISDTDFTENLIVWVKTARSGRNVDICDWCAKTHTWSVWRTRDVLAWMLPEPYKE